MYYILKKTLYIRAVWKATDRDLPFLHNLQLPPKKKKKDRNHERYENLKCIFKMKKRLSSQMHHWIR